MIKKKLLLLCLTAFTSIGVVAFVITNSFNTVDAVSNQIVGVQPGEVTISANNSSTVMNGSGTATYKSAFGNSFSFSYQNVTRKSGTTKYYTALEISNVTPMKGIYEIDIYSSESTIVINNNEYNVTNGLNTLPLIDSGTSYVTISGSNNKTFMFTYLTIRYTCSSEIEKQKVDYFKINKFNNIPIDSDSNNEVYINRIAAPYRSKLSDIEFDIEAYIGENHFNVTSDSPYLIRYISSNSETVLNKDNEATLCFVLNNTYYYLATTITLYGYSSSEVCFVNNSYPNEWPIQDNDNVPDDFILNGYGLINFYYSNGGYNYNDFYWVIYSDTYNIVSGRKRNYLILSDDMVVKKDNHAFSEIGDHSLTFSYYGSLVSINYCVYDPDYCIIKNIHEDEESPNVPFGCSASYFYEYIANFPLKADYFGGGTDTIYLDRSCFDIDDSMFISSNDSVYVPFTYQNYHGQILVVLDRTVGNVVETYTNDEGVLVYYEDTMATQIVLYDNGLACIFAGENYDIPLFNYYEGDNPQGMMYLIEGDVLTVKYYYYTFKFVLDNNDKSFAQYGSGSAFIELSCDFSLIGFGDELLVGRYYQFNNLLEYDYQGTTYNVECYDSEGIYMLFQDTGIECIGYYDIINENPIEIILRVTPVE